MAVVHYRPSVAQFLALRHDRALYELGQAHGLLTKQAGVPTTVHALTGRLYLSESGWLLLDVPNAVVRGLFDALHEPGIELPLRDGRLNAHVTVMRPEELQQLGGPEKVTERGHSYRYSLGPTRVVEPDGWKDVSKCWFVEIRSPELEALRRSYGLTSLPNDGKHQLHLTIAVRKKKVLHGNQLSKASAASKDCLAKQHSEADQLPGGAADGRPDADFSSKELALGRAEEVEHTSDPAIAGEIAKDHLVSEGPRYYTVLKRLEKMSAEIPRLRACRPSQPVGAKTALAVLRSPVAIRDTAARKKVAADGQTGVGDLLPDDLVGRRPLDIYNEDGFSGAFGRDAARSPKGFDLAEHLPEPARAAYAHLPRPRLLDSVAGGVVGAGLGAVGGLTVEYLRRLAAPTAGKRRKPSSSYLGSALTGAGMGALGGVGVANLVGDRARRYLSNVMPTQGIGYRAGGGDDKNKLPSAHDFTSPFKTVSRPDGTSTRELDWDKLWTAAVEDKPYVPKDPRFKSLFDNPAEMKTTAPFEYYNRAMRREVLRRQLGVHTTNPTRDWLSTNADGTLSINPSHPEAAPAIKNLLLPGVKPFDNAAEWVRQVNDTRASSRGPYGLMTWPMGGQVARLAPFPGKEKSQNQDLVEQLDRWDYTLRPNETGALVRGLTARVLGDQKYLKDAPEAGIDYASPNELGPTGNRDAQVSSLITRWLMNNLLVHKDPWIAHRMLVKSQGPGKFVTEPMTNDNRRYFKAPVTSTFNPAPDPSRPTAYDHSVGK